MTLSKDVATEEVLKELKKLYPEAFDGGQPKPKTAVYKLAQAIASLIPYIVENGVVSAPDPQGGSITGKIT
jgi:hypothetical protein